MKTSTRGLIVSYCCMGLCLAVVGYLGYRHSQLKKHVQKTIQTTSLANAAATKVFAISAIAAQAEHDLYKNSIFLVVAATIFLLLLLTAVWIRYRVGVVEFFTVLVLLGAMGTIWQLRYGFIEKPNKKFVPITNQTIVDHYRQKMVSDTQVAVVVKVGIFLTNAYYLPADTLMLSGYIWQRYPLNTPKAIEREFFMPECSRQWRKEKICTIKTSTEEIVEWFFSGEFHQKYFEKNKFPFDEQSIMVLMRPLDKNIVLVPDPLFYDITYQSTLVGVDPSLVLNDRVKIASYFAFQGQTVDQTENTLIPDQIKSSHDLYFIVSAKRSLDGIVFSYLLPLMLALMILYVCCISINPGKDNNDKVAWISGVFLTIVLMHTAMRSAINIDNGVSYLGYAYTLVYVLCCAILGYIVVININNNYRIVQWLSSQNNFWLKIFLFTTYFSIMFVITVCMLLN